MHVGNQNKKRSSFKLLKKQLRKFMENQMNEQAVNGSAEAMPRPANAPITPTELSPKQQYEQATNFLGQMLQQFTFPSHQVKGERVEALFADLRSFVEKRLAAEISAGE